MTSRKQLLFVYGLAVHLLIIGIVCYATFSSENSSENAAGPMRLMYKTAAGKVLFNHAEHFNVTGYGASCQDCHHHPPGDDSSIASCRSCHYGNEDDNKSGELSRKACLDCHDHEEIEDIEMSSNSDALHSKCQKCHEDIDAGPQECSGCHIL